MTKFKMIIIGGMGIDELPYRERWLLREHAGETISWIGPWLERYVRYWTVLPPANLVPDLVHYGSYTSGITMHVYNDYPPGLKEQWGMVGVIPMRDQKRSQTPGQVYSKAGAIDKSKPVDSAFCYVPFAPTQDFMGADLNPWTTSILRWFTVIKYPTGISKEEGEDWYLKVHSKEVMKQPGLLRYFSYLTMDWQSPPTWHRVVEQWYADYNSWHNAVVKSPPQYTKPAWAKYDQYPFFEPYKDFLGCFVLERPTHDLLRDYMGYVIGP
jgi:hypothetical protein